MSTALMGFALGVLQGVQQIQQRRLLEEAEARKEARLEEIRRRERQESQEFQIALMNKQQGFQDARDAASAQERKSEREARRADAAAQREFQAEQNRLNRASMEARVRPRGANATMVAVEDEQGRTVFMTLDEANELGIPKEDMTIISTGGVPRQLSGKGGGAAPADDDARRSYIESLLQPEPKPEPKPEPRKPDDSWRGEAAKNLPSARMMSNRPEEWSLDRFNLSRR